MIMIHIINELKLQHIQLKHIYTDIDKHRYTYRHIDTNNIQTLIVAYRYSSTITTTQNNNIYTYKYKSRLGYTCEHCIQRQIY